MTNQRIFALLLTVMFGMGVAQGQTPSAQPPAKAEPNPFLRILGNGVWWASLPNDAKDTFLDGYVTGMGRAYLYTNGECMQDKDKLKPGPQFDAELKSVLNLCILANLFDFDVDRRQLLTGLDEFYRDSQNTRIPVTFALEYTRDKLKGKKSAQELDDNLREWRRAVNK